MAATVAHYNHHHFQAKQHSQSQPPPSSSTSSSTSGSLGDFPETVNRARENPATSARAVTTTSKGSSNTGVSPGVVIPAAMNEPSPAITVGGNQQYHPESAQPAGKPSQMSRTPSGDANIMHRSSPQPQITQNGFHSQTLNATNGPVHTPPLQPTHQNSYPSYPGQFYSSPQAGPSQGGGGGGSPGPANYPPEVQAMMYAAWQQQQQHFQHQMAMMAQQQQQQSQHQVNDPRRRAPSLPNNLPQQSPPSLQQQQQQQFFYYPQVAPPPPLPHQQQQMYGQQQPQQPPPHMFRPQYPSHPGSFSNPHPPLHLQHQQPQYPFHHQHSASHSPIRGPPHGQQQHPGTRERSTTAPVGGSMPLPPQAPFAAHSQRPASPGSQYSNAEQARRRTESDPRIQLPPPPSVGTGGRTDSSQSEPRRPAHSPSSSFHAIPSSISSSNFAPPPRLRAESGLSSRSQSPSAGGAGSFRSASPASSDRAPTPTQASGSGSGRTTPTLASSQSALGLSNLAGASGAPDVASQHQQVLQPPARLVSQVSSSSLHASSAAGGIPRKASPLSQQANNRSTTPTQASPFASSNEVGGDSDEDGNESDGTASDRRRVNASAQAGVGAGGHRTTPSNASSAMTGNSSSPNTTSSSSGKGSSIFRSKLRKALSLNELNNNSSSSSLDSNGKKIGRSSLTSNSSSSDTSHSTMGEPRTPPNGVSPVLPSRFASASASNLNAGMGRQGSNGSGGVGGNTGSLPSNAGRRFGILNAKMNSSTDNISISSTVSSASVMLRKMGNLGKLARKSSVRSLSNIFHRNEKDGEHGRATSDAVSEFGVPGAAMASSKDRKKGGVSIPSVAHVTVELESGTSTAGGMTPAEALVRKHQEKEKAQREADEARRKAAAATSSASSSPTGDSPRSKLLDKEKEKLKNASVGKKSGDKKKWGFGGFSRSASSSSLRQDAMNASASSSSTSVPGAAQEHSPSPPSSAAPSPVFDSPSMSAQSSSSVEHKEHAPEPDYRPSLDGVQLDSWRNNKGGLALPPGAQGYPRSHGDFDDPRDEDDDDEGFDDRTPRQSIEVLGDQQNNGGEGAYADWDGEPPNGASFFEDDTASFTNASTVMQAEPEEYDDGGHDGRSGQKIPERPPKHARPAKGILKYARSYSQDNLTRPQPAFTRPRASSYDAPHQTSPPNQPGKLAALAQFIPSGDQVDGVAEHPSTASRLDTQASTSNSFELSAADKENMSPSSSSNSPYGNPSFNTSAPILSQISSVQMATRSMTGPQVKRRISFAHNLSVHTTWAGNIYDRRGETATCNRLTPALAQRIKEELNAFKMEEMEVHHASRNFTHFFV